jgi:hypothetical protein
MRIFKEEGIGRESFLWFEGEGVLVSTTCLGAERLLLSMNHLVEGVSQPHVAVTNT